MEPDSEAYPSVLDDLPPTYARWMFAASVPYSDQLADYTAIRMDFRDLAGNPFTVLVLAVKSYSARGRPISQAVGWYDLVSVHMLAFEVITPDLATLFEDLGTGAELELREGFDNASRRLLRLADVGLDWPIVIYAGSNNVYRTVYAWVPPGVGHWIAYSCEGNAPVVKGESEVRIPAARTALLESARAVCESE